MSLSAVQLVVLRMVAERRVSMFCDKCVWHFRGDEGDTINRRTIKAMEQLGLVSCSYYRDGAGISLTETGRRRIAEWDRNRSRRAA